MAEDPIQGVGRGEGQLTRKHLLQGDAQRIKIAAGISRAIHAAGLLGLHLGEHACNHLERYGRLGVAVGTQSRIR
jgi:hypothetical protein